MSRIQRFKKADVTDDMISAATKKNSKINKDFLVKYNLLDCKCKPHLINSFQTIGWSDPFPDDYKLIKGS